MTIQNNTVDMVKRSSNEFSFIETLDSMINNHEFRDGLQDFYVGKHNKYSFVWEALSAIGQEVGDTIYENVLNYIDIASNVDLCKVRNLQSISKSFGTDFSVLHGLENFPKEIQEMIDVLSINRKYIMQTNFLCEKLLDDIAKKAYQEIDEFDKTEISNRIISSDSRPNIKDEINIPGYITEQRYSDYLSGLYYDFMYEMVNLPYNTGLSVPIWWIEEREILENDKREDTTIEQFKSTHGIPKSFNVKKIVDDINNGLDYLENYDGYKKECLEIEMEIRSKTLRTNDYNDSYREKYKTGYDTKLRTRYSYNRKEKVKQYIEMIQSQYNGTNDIQNINGTYDIDKNYFVISKTPNTEYFIDVEKARKTVVDMSAVRTDMIAKIAQKLSQITIYISKIRDILKIQCQKYYAKGTFSLLQYVINEYLIELSQSDIFQDIDMVKTNVRANLSAHSFNNIDIIEYFDTTEYFNLSCSTTQNAYNKKTVNNRFWEQDQDENTNSGFCFSDQQISNFYLTELELNNQIQDLNRFLDTVFNYGATTSYTDSATTYNTTDGKDEDVKRANETMFLTYSGNKYGYRPYANLKNRVHSSIQVHPYLKSFIEYTRDKYPIINAFYNDTVNEIGEVEALARLSEYIGKYGETVNVAVNNQYDYSGYKTRYETTPHDGKYDVEGYDGLFFPPAIQDYLNDYKKFADSISCQTSFDKDGNTTAYGKYYQSLGYTQKCYQYIAEQLIEYHDKIVELAREKNALSDVHDIFKYGVDGYDNMYILLKKYSSYNISYNDKKSVPGQLWIRRKNNPIPFPAFIGDRSAVDTETDFNGNIKYLAAISCVGRSVSDGSELYEHVMKIDPTDMSYFYDMEFSRDRKTLMLAVYPVNDVFSVEADGKYNNMISSSYYLDYQHSDILINEIDQWYDTVDKRDKLYLQARGKGRYSKENSYNSMDSEDVHEIYGKSFIGFYKNGGELAPVFINKTYDKDTKTYSIDEQHIKVSMQIWTSEGIDRDYNNLHLPFRNAGGKIGYGISDGQVEFSNNGRTLTFAFLTKPKTQRVQIQSYVGMHNGKGQAEYISQTSGYSILEEDMEEMNSFDMLDTFITTVDSQIINDECVDCGFKTYNFNSDASYIPAYPGEIGYTDVSKTNYAESPTKSFEILGESNNIDDTISLVNPNADTSRELSSYLEEYTHGMTWEDYKPNEDNSLREFTYNQVKDGGPDKGQIIWSIDLNQYNYAEKDLSSMSIVMYNKRSNGKNPYYIGKFIDLSATYSRPFISLRDDLSSYQDSVSDHEISSISNPRMRVSGTYDYFSGKINASDSNHLPNVRDIQIYTTKDRIVITFCPEDYDKKYYIRNNTVTLILCDPADIKIFQYHHFLDHRQAVSSGMIDGVYLSSIELSDYSYLSDVPGLSGFDNLDFKYSEQDVFDISSNSYYFPYFNMSYPYRGVDTFTQQRTNKSDYNVINMDGIFNQKNLFVVKIDKNAIIDEIGEMSIPVQFMDNECMMGYEEYIIEEKTKNIIKDNTRSDYDVNDPRVLSTVEMYDTIGTIGKANIELVTREETGTCVDRISETCGFNTAFLEQTSAMYTVDYTQFHISEKDFQGIDKLLNIYVNYKKEKDNGITLFFNYYNYINSPFVKISNNKIIMDTREGTYLRLGSGENGLLNIELQFKEYDYNNDLVGFSNVRVATYRIFNISDDKPKFLLHKISGIDKDKMQFGESLSKITIDSQTLLISKKDIGKNIEFSINIHVDSNKILESGKYSITYPSNELKCLSEGVEKGLNSITIDVPRGRTLTFTTIPFTKEVSYSFSARNISMYDTNGVKTNVEVYPGQTTLKPAHYLRKESKNVEDLVLTENYNNNKKINI